MTYPHSPENIKVCPECGTNLIKTARRCAVCGHSFTETDLKPSEEEGGAHKQPRQMLVSINLPVLLGLIILFVSMIGLMILGLQKRDQTKTLAAAEQATATYIATTYVSPTPTATAVHTPAPPTQTPVVDIEYTVVSGDSCLSIAKHFNIYLDSILARNNIDCAVLKIGTVLKIPHPTATPESTSPPAVTATP